MVCVFQSGNASDTCFVAQMLLLSFLYANSDWDFYFRVFSGPVATSVFLDNCTACSFVLACQQVGKLAGAFTSILEGLSVFFSYVFILQPIADFLFTYQVGQLSRIAVRLASLPITGITAG